MRLYETLPSLAQVRFLLSATESMSQWVSESQVLELFNLQILFEAGENHADIDVSVFIDILTSRSGPQLSKSKPFRWPTWPSRSATDPLGDPARPRGVKVTRIFLKKNPVQPDKQVEPHPGAQGDGWTTPSSAGTRGRSFPLQLSSSSSGDVE